MMNHILIVDDEENLRFFLKQTLQKQGYSVQTAENIAKAEASLEENFPDLILLDLNLTDGNGLDFYKQLKQKEISIPTIVITAHGSIESAIEAMKSGVDDYISKPFNVQELELIIDRLLARFHLKNQLNYFRRQAQGNKEQEFFISQLPIIEKLQSLALKIAEVSTGTILIEGATGTGKEMFARYVHNNSAQADQPFVEINCASLPDNLLESELFGYEPGAFTDARKRKIGLIELAQGGTLFLDEIAEMSLTLQAKLLRFIESRRFKRLGGVQDIKVDLRIIAASNRGIEKQVEEKKFREDLFFRLNMFHLKLPTLEERRDEILLMTQFFLEKINQRLKKNIKALSSEARQIILGYSWPGNIRELCNVLERAIILTPYDTIEAQHLPKEIRRNQTTEQNVTPNLNLLENSSLKDFLNNLEKSLVIQALEVGQGNQLKAARLLNEPRHILRYLIKKHGLEEK